MRVKKQAVIGATSRWLLKIGKYGIIKSMDQSEKDKNLLVVTAIEGFAEKHQILEEKVYEKFSRHGIIDLVRAEYDALHTQPLEETVQFVEDVMSRYETGETQ